MPWSSPWQLVTTLAFKSPLYLLCLLVVPVAIGGYLLLEQRRARKAAGWATPALLPNMVSGNPGRLRYVPAAIFGAALFLLLVGFARPESKFREAKDGATVVLMIDDSGSMGANDVKPTRLLAADAALTTFIDKVPSRYRIALITFSTSIAAKVPPTYDRDTVIRALPKKAEQQGTALGLALKEAVTVAKKAVGPSKPGAPHPPATILLVSDGGSNSGSVTPEAAAKLAQKAAIPVSTVALGTAAGIVHQVVRISKTQTAPYQRQVPVQPSTLKTVAKASGGTFYKAVSGDQLNKVYKDMNSRLVYGKQFREITVGLTGAALILILAGAALSAYWFRRLI
jgi:Ca-activated chloride channel family protein